MVIALKTEDRVIVATTIADSIDDMAMCDKTVKENIPFWKVRGTKDCFVFAEDLTYVSDLLRYNDYIFKNITDGSSIITDVVPQMKMLLDSYGYIHDGRKWPTRLVIVKGNKIFSISKYFVVDEIDEFVAFGCDSILKGAMEECADLPAEERILFAVNHLCCMENRMLFPLTLFDTKTKKRKVIYK